MQLVFIQTTISVPHIVMQLPRVMHLTEIAAIHMVTDNDENIERHKIFKMVIKLFLSPYWRPFV